jgi:hypothetical protein
MIPLGSLLADVPPQYWKILVQVNQGVGGGGRSQKILTLGVFVLFSSVDSPNVCGSFPRWAAVPGNLPNTIWRPVRTGRLVRKSRVDVVSLTWAEKKLRKRYSLSGEDFLP